MVADMNELLERARRVAGASDFGPDGWQVGLKSLLGAVDTDVTDSVQVRDIEANIVDRLVARLEIEAWYAEHGDEASAPVVDPVMILGLPRTATTATHFLLANDDRFRYVRAWEVWHPAPPPVLGREHDDPRRVAHKPAVNERHIVAVDGPAEDWPIHAINFDHAELILPVPSHAAWWRRPETDHSGLFPYHERVLRMLHSHRPPERWLLKTPAFMFVLGEVAAHYPTARFIWTHRDPIAVIASTCSVVADGRKLRTPTWTPDPTFGRGQLDHWSRGMRAATVARDAVGEDRFLDIAQRDLEADPIAVAERIYDFVGLPLDDALRATMLDWATQNRRGARGAHRYNAEQYGLSDIEIQGAFAPYLERFGESCRAG